MSGKCKSPRERRAEGARWPEDREETKYTRGLEHPQKIDIKGGRRHDRKKTTNDARREAASWHNKAVARARFVRGVTMRTRQHPRTGSSWEGGRSEKGSKCEEDGECTGDTATPRLDHPVQGDPGRPRVEGAGEEPSKERRKADGASRFEPLDIDSTGEAGRTGKRPADMIEGAEEASLGSIDLGSASKRDRATKAGVESKRKSEGSTWTRLSRADEEGEVPGPGNENRGRTM